MSYQLKDIVLKLATQFINISARNLDDHIDKTLEIAGTFLHMDRAYLFEYDLKKRTMTNTHEWCAPGIEHCIDILQDIDMDSYPDWTRYHLAGQIIKISSVASLPDDQLKNILLLQGIKSLIAVPIMDEDTCLGFVGFDAVRHEVDWSEDHISLVKMIAEIYCNVLKRRDMELRLEASEKRYQDLVEGLPVGLYRRLPGPGGEFIMVNTAMARMFGYKRKEDLVGVKIAKFCVDMEKMKECALEMAKTGIIREKNVRFKRRNGEIFWASISAKEHTDEDGNVLYIEGMVQDITERIRQEEEKERLRQQLQQVQRLESIGRLAGGVAHDFNNLLVPILGYSELLLEMAGHDEKIKRYVEPIKEAGERARDIVRQLLAFGRKQELEKIPVRLNDCLTSFQKFLRHTLRDNIRVVLETDPATPLVECDVRQLEQALLNLAVNAQDAMPGGGTICIGTGRVEIEDVEREQEGALSPGTYAILTIRDTGTGMDSKTLEQIFEPFFTTKSVEKGTGLGLAMVYGIIRQHGGNIQVESTPGKGTLFTIYLPASNAAGEMHEQKSDSEPVHEGVETILLVEDEESVRDFVAYTLERCGYKVIKAAGYQEVVERLQELQEGVDLLLTDVIMPGLNGIEIYSRLKQIYPSLKVLYMSGNAPESISLESEGHFLQKPFSVKTLTNMVRTILDEGRSIH